MSKPILVDAEMPPLGVADALLEGGDVTPAERMSFWLLTHTMVVPVDGVSFWRTAVIRECVPDPDGDLRFEAVS